MCYEQRVDKKGVSLESFDICLSSMQIWLQSKFYSTIVIHIKRYYRNWEIDKEITLNWKKWRGNCHVMKDEKELFLSTIQWALSLCVIEGGCFIHYCVFFYLKRTSILNYHLDIYHWNRFMTGKICFYFEL